MKSVDTGERPRHGRKNTKLGWGWDKESKNRMGVGGRIKKQDVGGIKNRKIGWRWDEELKKSMGWVEE